MQSRRTMMVVSLSLMIGLAACAGGDGEHLSALASSQALRPDTSIGGAWIYRNPQADFRRYRAVIIDNVAVYNGPEASFGSATVTDRQRYAQLVGEELRRVIGEKYRLVNRPAAHVLRLRPTLIGVRGTIGGVATVTRVIPLGLAINAVRGVAGAGGTLTGGIELAIELYDSQSNELLAGAVRQFTPGTFDIGATLSTEKTVQSTGNAAGMALRDAMDRVMKARQ